jgi:hypothetical protein
MKSWILAILLAIVAIAPAGYLVYNRPQATSVEPPVLTTVEFVKPPQPELEVGLIYEVRACKVIDGYRFGMFLEGDKWIEAHLTSATKNEVTQVVIDWLNNTKAPVPTVKLLRKTSNHWIVDFRLTIGEKQESVTALLKAKSLLLE